MEQAMVQQISEDRMTLAGIKIYPRIGVTPEERSVPQECQADLILWGSFEAAAATDALDQSIDYCQILSAVQKIAEVREYNLLETLAYGIVQNILQNFPVAHVRVKLRKQPASLLNFLDFVEVEVEGP
jgi:7,8-dihydroneopterin aldolase/epimerase/oxygenase